MSDAVEQSARSMPKRIAFFAIEIVLVLLIIGLLVATWLPAIIGANPDAAPFGM